MDPDDKQNYHKKYHSVTCAKILFPFSGPDEVTIKSEQLYAILKSGKLKVMILDVRSAKDYKESHIHFPGCISVPEEVISPG